MRHFRRHANAFTKRWVRMNGLADIDCICTHFNRQRDFTNHVACVGADHAATQNFAVTVGFGAVIKQ